MFKGRWFWSAVPIAVVAVIALILMSYGPMYRPGVYCAVEAVPVSGSWAEGETPALPRYEITEEGQLLARGDWKLLEGEDPADPAEWVELGSLTKVKLTKRSFDRLFRSGADWPEGLSPAALRRGSVQAWYTAHGSAQYYFLQRKGGGFWLVSGFYDASEKGDPASDDSNLQLLFRLEREEG